MEFRQRKDNSSSSSSRQHRDTSTSNSSFRQHKDTGEKKPTRYFSKKQETAVASAIGGKTVANSGATAYAKGDVTDSDWLIECKTCVKDQESFSVKKGWFTKNLEESIYMKKNHTAVVFSFGPNSKNYYIVDEPTFLRMKELLDRYGDEDEVNE